MPRIPRITRTNSHGHAAFFYESEEERLWLLAKYFREGLARRELCIFVTDEPSAKVLGRFKAIGTDFTPAVKAGSLRIFEMEPTYLPDGKFAADFMLENVRNFLGDSERLGFRGLRTAGEMSWLYDHPEASDEALRYENQVNKLQSDRFIGLCMYPVQEKFAKVLRSVGHTHPSLIYDGGIRTNQYYSEQSE
jgi:hypothetical protein